MEEQNFDAVKVAVLDHIQNVFTEMEEELVISHQEKFAMLEDAFENAVDAGELKVAFEHWYHDHADDIDFGYGLDELWDQALGNIED